MQIESKIKNRNLNPNHRKLWIILLFLVTILSSILIYKIIFSNIKNDSIDRYNPPKIAEMKFGDRVVLGDLGGSLVSIPSHFAQLVEYDKDPGWSGNINGSEPVRTRESKIRSFGLYVRYPDMAGRSTQELSQDYDNRKLATNQWISVIFSSGEDYTGPGGEDRIGNGRINSKSDYWFTKYSKINNDLHGLEVYAHTDIDPKNGKSYRDNKDAKDIFIKKNGSGKITTYIACSNQPIPSAPCKHVFGMEPEMNVLVSIGYRRGLLSEWQEIQKKVKALTLSFAVNEK